MPPPFPAASPSRIAAAASADGGIPYDWRERWYALTHADHVPGPSDSAEVVPASVFGEPLVLWRAEDGGPVRCADDVCPHRSAALSEGRLRDGNVECYYHGWQFSGDDGGRCVAIPQLEEGASLPRSARLRMRECRTAEGIVWAWMGDGEPTRDPPTQGDGLEDIDPVTGRHPEYVINDFQIDLPYDHSFLVENLLDPAHIPISHDRTPGGGKRENAQAYEMLVDPESVGPDGFRGRYRTAAQRDAGGPFVDVVFEAPGTIRQRGKPRGDDSDFRFGAALHCMPLALGRSRLLFRAYFTGLPPMLRFLISSKPKFLQNLNSCKILEQDAGLITTQEDHFARTGRRIADDYILLSSSDVFVGAYRRWLDGVGHGMPWFQGLATRSPSDGAAGRANPALDPANHRAGNVLETRYHRHVRNCPATRKALARVRAGRRVATGLAVSAAAASCGLLSASPGAWRAAARAAAALVPASALAAAGLGRLERRFYVSFERTRDQLRGESGLDK